MKIQYDPEAKDYRAPKELVADISLEHSRPSARAKACSLVLGRVEGDFATRLDRLLHATAIVLKVKVGNIMQIGLEEARKAWLAGVERELEHKRQPVWYYSTRGPGRSVVANYPPSSDETYVAGPVAIPEEEIVNRPGFRGDLFLWEDRSWATEAGTHH